MHDKSPRWSRRRKRLEDALTKLGGFEALRRFVSRTRRCSWSWYWRSVLSLSFEKIMQHVQLLALGGISCCTRKGSKCIVERSLMRVVQKLYLLRYSVHCSHIACWRPQFTVDLETQLVPWFKRADEVVKTLSLLPRCQRWYRYRGGSGTWTVGRTIALRTGKAGWLLHERRAMQTTWC